MNDSLPYQLLADLVLTFIPASIHDNAILLERDPGQAGIAEMSYYRRALVGYSIYAKPVTKDKQTRARPVSAQAEGENIKLVRGPWNEAFIRELENFPDGAHDDQVDALSGAFNTLLPNQRIFVA